MSATATEREAFEYSILYDFIDYGAKLARFQKLGRKELECYKFKFRLLNHFVRVLVDYLDSDDYENVNFFTVSEINDIIQHINNITGSNRWLDL